MKPPEPDSNSEIGSDNDWGDETNAHPALEDMISKWNDEARALKAIKALEDGLGHKHIIKYLGSIKRGYSFYLMFPWAKGGNLQQYWRASPRRTQALSIVEALEQLLGVAGPLQLLHDPDSAISGDADSHQRNRSIRHGDIKPDNLLWFCETDASGNTKMVLKIADMGLAKQHWEHTHNREFQTRTMYSTPRYEPPDAWVQDGARSRLYDVWSLGCVMFEWLIWLLWGNVGLLRFREDLEQSNGRNMQFFSTLPSDAGKNIVELHSTVRTWMDYIRTHHPQCVEGSPSALRDLLDIIERRLLVVRLPPATANTHRLGEQLFGRPSFPFPNPHADGTSTLNVRATAEQLCFQLKEILRKASSTASYPSYLLRAQHGETVDMPPRAARAVVHNTSGNVIASDQSDVDTIRNPVSEPRSRRGAGHDREMAVLPFKDWRLTLALRQTVCESSCTAIGSKDWLLTSGW